MADSVVYPIGGMDYDSEDRSIEAGDYRYALNIRNSYAYAERRGVATNVKGTELIPFTLPQGDNETIGYLEDTDDRTGIYFVWNSNGNHSILRYYPQDVAPYGYIEKVIEFDFGWTREERITGVALVDNKLLYWTDSVSPRKINIEKANNTNKKKSWEVIMPNNYVQPFQTWGWNIYDMGGTQVFAGVFSFTGDTTREQAFEQIADAINATASQYLVAESCGCKLKVSETGTNQVYFDFAGNSNYFVIPENWYGLTPYEWFFNLAKIPPPYAPLTEYKADDTYGFNNVSGFAWQHRTQNYYDDGEETVLSPYSQIPVNNNVCNENVNRALNYIKVNFNNSYAIDANALILLKRIRVIARKNNDAPDKKYIEIEPCEWLTIIDGQIAAAYNFYNNTIEATLSDSLALRLYDDVPLKSEGLAYAANRLVPANNLKNYNSPDCIEAEITQTFNTDVQPKLRRVRVYTSIYSPGMSDPVTRYTVGGETRWYPPQYIYRYASTQSIGVGDALFLEPSIYERNGLILHDTSRTDESLGGNFPYYGGAGYGSGAGADFGIRAGMETEYDQRCPMGGWAIYSAGTYYFGITRQNINHPLPTDRYASLDTSTEQNVWKIGNWFYPTQNHFINSYVDLYLPDGVHTLRVASHWCSNGDVLDKGAAYDLNNGLVWQKTSAPIWGLYTLENGNYVWNGGKTELTITVDGADIDYACEFVVTDLAPIHDRSLENNGSWEVFSGYVYDNNGMTDPNAPSWAGLPVEKALTYLTFSKHNEGQLFFTDEISSKWISPTDHNGFYFIPVSVYALADENFDVSVVCVSGDLNGQVIVKSNDYGDWEGTLSNLFDKTLVQAEIGYAEFINKLNSYISISNRQDARSRAMTFVSGYLVDNNGVPMPKVNCVYENSGFVQSDTTGFFKIRAWADLKNYILTFGWVDGAEIDAVSWSRAIDGVVFNYGIFCSSVFSQNKIPVTIFPLGANPTEQVNLPPYSPTSIAQISDTIVTLSDSDFYKSRKRGGRYFLNMRFYDRFGRLCSVVPIDEIYIPFVTEDLGLTLPNYPLGTYLDGIPSISWQLGNLPSELSWAHSYDFMWSKDVNYGYYLQWVINDVQYLLLTAFGEGDDRVEDIFTQYDNYDATAIRISITNTVDYYRANNQSLVSYDFQVGDKVRIITNDKNEYFNGRIIEFEITNATDSSQVIYLKNEFLDVELKAGFTIEIYRVLDQANNDQQLYYETAERFPCTAPDTPLNDFSVKNGTFTSGDTYWRGRVILVNDETRGIFQYKPVFIEDSSISDFYASNSSDIGRFGIIDPNFNQAWFPTMLQNSGVYVTGSTVNGLSSFDLADNIELYRAFGDVKMLVLIGDVLLGIQQSKLTSIYLQKILSIDANGSENFVTLADKFFGTQRPLKGDWGTNHPSSVQQKDGLVIGWDNRLKQMWQYDANGLDTIVQKMSSYFTTLPEFNDDYIVGSVWDKFYNEYIFTAYKRSDNTGLTIAYQKDKNKWTTFYGFKHENYGRISNKIVSFVNGQLYLHDVNEFGRNNFAGVQDTSVLRLVFNAEPFIEKIWFALRLEQKSLNGQNDWAAPSISNRNGQASRLFKTAFRKIEEYWFAYFKRDLTTNVPNPIANGKSLRSSSLTVELVNDSELEVELRTAIANTDAS